MQKKISIRKKQFASLFILIVFSSVFVFNALFSSSFFAQSAPIFAFYYEKNANKKKLEDAFKGNGDGGDPAIHGSTLAQTTILARGALGGQDFEMQYNADITEKFGNDNGEFFYSKTYYCTLDNIKGVDNGFQNQDVVSPGGNVSFEAPSDRYITIDYVIGFKTKTGKVISENANINPAYVGYPRATVHIDGSADDGKKYGSISTGIVGSESPSSLLQNATGGGNDLNVNTLFKGEEGDGKYYYRFPQACVPPNLGQFDLKNYYGLNESQKNAFAGLVNTAENSTNPSGSAGSGTDDANCEGGGALGWIICPISELIANFATDMFEDVIAPMLENVPISLKRTGPESGGFQAWQSMRVIANVLLVVSLLAVVYSQAKGGD
ncbi:hypothetical protein HZB74_03550 [Candidatus Saccharibacteria bacterium]|nr:hypothetical protein [Candidatus Saccharibacteria bacterium]